MNVATVQRALAELQKQASETSKKAPAAGVDDLIDALTEKIGDTDAQEGIKKEAYLRRRSNLLMAKMLAGVDALVSQRSG